MTNEQQSANLQDTEKIEGETGVSYAIPARRVTWLLIHLLIVLSAATATLAILLSGDPAGRPLWLILLVAAVVLCCLSLTYALGKAVIHPTSQPKSSEQSPPV